MRNYTEACRCGHGAFCVIPNPPRIKAMFGPTGHIGLHQGILWQEFAGMHGMYLWLLDCKIRMSYCSDTFWSTAVKLLEQKQY